jgi:hypothetical protein
MPHAMVWGWLYLLAALCYASLPVLCPRCHWNRLPNKQGIVGCATGLSSQGYRGCVITPTNPVILHQLSNRLDISLSRCSTAVRRPLNSVPCVPLLWHCCCVPLQGIVGCSLCAWVLPTVTTYAALLCAAGHCWLCHWPGQPGLHACCRDPVRRLHLPCL